MPTGAIPAGDTALAEDIADASPFLRQLMLRDPGFAGRVFREDANELLTLQLDVLKGIDPTLSQAEVMAILRRAKKKVALVTGVNTATPGLLMVHADHLGRPIRLTDATRATVWSASYDPFGQPWQVTGTVEQNLRFPGQYFLIESGLSYNWHRFYDPATGRYTQPDPLRFVDGPSVYGYAGASPMMRVDPEGLSDEGYRGLLDSLGAFGIPHQPYPPLTPKIPPMCAGPSEDHAKEECDKAADGTDDDWRFFCNSSSFFVRYDKTRPARCQKESNKSKISKKNWCYNEFGE